MSATPDPIEPLHALLLACEPAPAPLPAGKTCSDCASLPKCEWLLSRTGREATCDWWPSRYRPRCEDQ